MRALAAVRELPVSAGLTTSMSTRPGACAGAIAVNARVCRYVTASASNSPKYTRAAAVKPAPVMLTRVPPAASPALGATPAMDSSSAPSSGCPSGFAGGSSLGGSSLLGGGVGLGALGESLPGGSVVTAWHPTSKVNVAAISTLPIHRDRVNMVFSPASGPFESFRVASAVQSSLDTPGLVQSARAATVDPRGVATPSWAKPQSGHATRQVGREKCLIPKHPR